MTAHDLNVVLQVSCIAILVVAGAFLCRYTRATLNTWAGIGLIAAVICYLVLETSLVQEQKVLLLIAVTGSISIPVFFLLLAKTIFDDHFTPTGAIALWFAVEIGSHFWIYGKDFALIPTPAQELLYVTSEVISIAFVLAGIYTALETRKGDLIESRRKFRNIFVMTIGALIGITLIVESMPILRESVVILQILQRLSILGLTVYFLLSNFEIKAGFFFRAPQKEKSLVIVDDELHRKLDVLITENRIYCKEGLTIGELAELLNEQEYKVRRLINGELGFRNFNDFLNKYRVSEACAILSDPGQNRKTILEIAYSLGYKSIGPFNKAFRELKQTTPTAYRKGPEF